MKKFLDGSILLYLSLGLLLLLVGCQRHNRLSDGPAIQADCKNPVYFIPENPPDVTCLDKVRNQK